LSKVARYTISEKERKKKGGRERERERERERNKFFYISTMNSEKSQQSNSIHNTF
jgi:hypothetical protein